MNPKRMKEHLRRIHDQWVDSIEDPHVQHLVKRDSIITGGAIVSLLQGEEPKDYDIYFKTKEAVLAVAKYYVEKFNEANEEPNKLGHFHKAFVIDGAKDIQEQVKDAGEDSWKTMMLKDIPEDRVKIIIRSDGVKSLEESPDQEALLGYEEMVESGDDVPFPLPEDTEKKKKKKGDKPPYRPLMLTTNAITLANKIQLIIRFYGKPEEVLDTFDFVHCFSYWTSDLGELDLNPESLEAILDKRLVYKGSRYPICSIIRIRKFLNRGWKINAGQILKMVFQVNNFDLIDPKVLEDQLVGVDTLYFKALIEAIKNEQEKKKDFQVDEQYVSTIVDKVFG